MYFRNVICTVALATLASAAVAKQIPTPYSSTDFYEDAVDDEVFEREAEAEAARTAAWEEAHGGTAPSYHYGEEHDEAAWHVARDAEAEPGWENVNGGQPPAWLAQLKSKATSATEAVKNAVPTVKPFTKQSGGLKKHHGSHKLHSKHGKQHTRDVDSEDDDEFEDEDEVLYARDFDDDPIPDFGDQDVDTSLEGLLEARDVDLEEEGEDEPENPDLSGYDEDVLQRRSDGTADNVDYSLEGYEDIEDSVELDPVIKARSLNEENEYDEYLRSEEHRSLLESIGVTKRDPEDDLQDEEEFDEELYARTNELDLLAEGEDDEDDEDLAELHARDVVDDEAEEFDIDDKDEDLEELHARDVVDDEVQEFDIDDDVDTSLDGLGGSPNHARGVDDEDLEDDEDVDSAADAAYDGAEVVEELVAPVLG